MPKKKKAIEKLMEKTDIPGLSMASMKNGDIDYTALGVTSCGFYKVKQLPKDEAMTKFDSSRYLLTDEGLYFYNISTKRLETVSEYDVIVKNTMDEISKDPMYQKFNQIPALKAHQLEHIKKETGHQFQPQKIDEHTQFGAASLSKPVFFYLVLRIIEDENLKKELGLEHFNLNTKLADLLPGFAERSDFAKDITVGMALSHQTGVHDPSQDYGAPEILFEPGSQFGYSGFPLIYLQMALEKNTGHTLEQLAQKYVFEPCEMNNSTFLKKGYDDSLPNYPETSSVFPADIDSYSSVAANSLRTTAEDYAKFMLEWMHDDKLSKYLTTPVVTLTKDEWANAVGIEEERLNNLAWGHGIGLQLDKGEVTAVFHNGDMNQWRAVITMNPKTKTGTVFFSNSHNGDVLTQEITKGVLDAGAACDYMRDKFGFAMADEEDWEAKQMSRMEHIGLVIMEKSLEAAKLNLDRASEQLLTAKSALDNIKKPTHKPTGKNDKDWVVYEEKILELSGNVTLAEEQLKNAKVRYQHAKKAVGQLNPKIVPSWQIDLINQILNAMDNYYCLPDKFSKKREELKNSLVIKCKEINETILNNVSPSVLPSPEQYQEISSQLNEVLHHFDPHLELEYNPKFIEEMTTSSKIKKRENSAIFDFSDGPPKEEIEKWNQYEQDNPTTRNFGFIDYQGPSGVIPDNIGYVNISHLLDPQLGANEAEEKYRIGPNAIKRLHEVMGGLQKKEGIILDLSVTPYGGSPEMVQNIVSFFMPDGTPINTVHDRVTRTQKPYETISTPCKLFDKPVVILVGPNTFSGREETAYDLQQYNTTLEEKRFTVMGQSTKGGAHPECSFPLVNTNSGEINDTFVLRVPYATSINPISGTNWEDGSRPGVQPDIEIPKEENSLVVAVKHLNSIIPQYSKTESVTQETEELLKSRERMQDFKEKMPHKAPNLTSSQEDVKRNVNSSISPFQITPKPPWEQ